MITKLSLLGFGSNGPADQVTIRNAFDYKDGKLFWKIRPAHGVQIGDEAGWLSSKGYRGLRVGGKSHLAHRLIWVLHHGEWPKEIDHINGDRSDDRIENLRSVNRSQNTKNRRKNQNNKSGVTGVRWETRDEKWAAQISFSGKNRFLGRFDRFEDAVAARKSAEKQYEYHPNHGRQK